jgi:hypothetical protein
VRKNTADTALTCTINNPSVSCADTSNSVSFSSGDLLSVKARGTGNPTATPGRWTAKLSVP